MPSANGLIATAFEQIADLLELQDANPFRVRAYRKAARVVGGLDIDLAELIRTGKPLPKLPGIGTDLAVKIVEIVMTGHSAMLDKLRTQVPPAVADLLQLPSLGPKRVRLLYDELHVQTLPQLLRAAKDGRVGELPGFGERTQQRIVAAIEKKLSKAQRYKLAVAAPWAEALLAHVKAAPGVTDAAVAGSFRRARETVGDLDLVVGAAHSTPVVERFVSYVGVREVLARGGTRAAVVLDTGAQVDLRVVPATSYGAALLYFTGSEAHNIALRTLALARGCKLNEYGLFKDERAIAGASEDSVYRALGLPWIAPELREDRGEFDAAQRNALPRLIEGADLLGDLHAHTRWSDGTATIEQMAAAAQARGLRYVAISEHSKRLAMAHGLDAARLAQQCGEIERVNRTLRGVTLLTGIEVDILEDGSLDLPDEVLAPLEVVIAAVHSNFKLSREAQTRRMLRALDNPNVSLLAHPIGRLIDAREPYNVDMHALIRRCAERQVALELNAHPERLDLLDTWCRVAKEAGVKVAINSDAHAPNDFDNLRFGIGQARRGWLEKDDVLNTRSLADVRAWLATRKIDTRAARRGRRRAA